MSSSQPPPQRMVQQDFIARIRFSNALPAPPIPPKLLDMPELDFASSHYTTPAFASRLAREQPVNIEADAELGMPLDLIGMPGVFNGDMASIETARGQPPIHPNDRALLRPLSTLGRPAVDASVSFLRRTGDISSPAPSRPNPRARASSVDGDHAADDNKRPAALDSLPAEPEDLPAAIRRRIDGEFEAAAHMLRGPTPHPDKPNVTLVEALPILPDLDAFPDSGAYSTFKFVTAPLPGSSVYDNRLLTGLFRPIGRSAAEDAAFRKAVAAHERDPELNPKPQSMLNYELYLGEAPADARQLREKLNPEYPSCRDDRLYTQQRAKPCFRFQRLRGYETSAEMELDHATKYDQEILLSINDDTDGKGKRCMFFYPVMQRTTIRPQRNKNIARRYGLDLPDDDQLVELLDVTVSDPPAHILEKMERYRERPRERADVPESQTTEVAEAEEDAIGERENDGDGESIGGSRQASQAFSDDDAEGDEDDE